MFEMRAYGSCATPVPLSQKWRLRIRLSLVNLEILQNVLNRRPRSSTRKTTFLHRCDTACSAVLVNSHLSPAHFRLMAIVCAVDGHAIKKLSATDARHHSNEFLRISTGDSEGDKEERQAD